MLERMKTEVSMVLRTMSLTNGIGEAFLIPRLESRLSILQVPFMKIRCGQGIAAIK